MSIDDLHKGIQRATEQRYMQQLHTWMEMAVLLIKSKPICSQPVKNGRLAFNQAFVPVLEYVFSNKPNPSHMEKVQLARKSGMSYRQIHVWFQNHRSRSRKSGTLPQKPAGIDPRALSLENLLRQLDGARQEAQKMTPSDACEMETVYDSSDEEEGPEVKRGPVINAALRDLLERPAPHHAYPNLYPPFCDYRPFPYPPEGCFHPFEAFALLRRQCQNTAGLPPVDLDDFLRKFSLLNVREKNRKRHIVRGQDDPLRPGKPKRYDPPRQKPDCEAAILAKTIRPVAPLPALVRTMSSGPMFRPFTMLFNNMPSASVPIGSVSSCGPVSPPSAVSPPPAASSPSAASPESTSAPASTASGSTMLTKKGAPRKRRPRVFKQIPGTSVMNLAELSAEREDSVTSPIPAQSTKSRSPSRSSRPRRSSSSGPRNRSRGSTSRSVSSEARPRAADTASPTRRTRSRSRSRPRDLSPDSTGTSSSRASSLGLGTPSVSSVSSSGTPPRTEAPSSTSPKKVSSPDPEIWMYNTEGVPIPIFPDMSIARKARLRRKVALRRLALRRHGKGKRSMRGVDSGRSSSPSPSGSRPTGSNSSGSTLLERTPDAHLPIVPSSSDVLALPQHAPPQLRALPASLSAEKEFSFSDLNGQLGDLFDLSHTQSGKSSGVVSSSIFDLPSSADNNIGMSTPFVSGPNPHSASGSMSAEFGNALLQPGYMPEGMGIIPESSSNLLATGPDLTSDMGDLAAQLGYPFTGTSDPLSGMRDIPFGAGDAQSGTGDLFPGVDNSFLGMDDFFPGVDDLFPGAGDLFADVGDLFADAGGLPTFGDSIPNPGNPACFNLDNLDMGANDAYSGSGELLSASNDALPDLGDMSYHPQEAISGLASVPWVPDTSAFSSQDILFGFNDPHLDSWSLDQNSGSTLSGPVESVTGSDSNSFFSSATDFLSSATNFITQKGTDILSQPFLPADQSNSGKDDAFPDVFPWLMFGPTAGTQQLN